MADLKITAFAQWFGSNRLLAAEVGKLLDGVPWVGIPFAGGMCELAHIKARTLVVNDLHAHVINMARVAADSVLGPRLYRMLRRAAFHPDELLLAQCRCAEREKAWTGYADRNASLWGGGHPITEKEPAEIPDLGWAYDYFVATWMGRGGGAGADGEFEGNLSVRWTASGGDSATRFRSAASGLPEWRRIMRRCTFQSEDALTFLDEINDQEDCGIYCDPPFPGPGDAYKHQFGAAEQADMAKKLAGFARTKIVCRFYDHEMVRKLYPASHWTWQIMTGGKTRTNKAAPEVLLTNWK